MSTTDTTALHRTASTTPTRHVEANGIRFAYRELGPAAGTPLVLLHHFTATIDDWDPRVLDGIAAHRRVIVFDNRGVGGTNGRVPRNVATMADDAQAFLDALGLPEVDLLGFSLGGFVAQVIAATSPGRVRRLILAGTGPAGGKGVGEVSWRLLGDSLQGLLRRRDPKPLLFFTRTAHGKAAATAYMDRLRERSHDRVAPTTLRSAGRQLVAIMRWGAQEPMDLGAVQHPALVVNGEDDRMLPTSASFDLANRLPNATLWIYPDAGHGGVFQNHAHFVPFALAFLGNP